MGKHGKAWWKLSNLAARNRVGEHRATDGVHCRVDGAEARVFGPVDTESGFVIVFDRAPKKRGYDAKPPLGRAVDAAGLAPRTRIADGPDTLPAAAAALGDFVLHVRDAGVRKSHANNNLYERFNGTLKDTIGRARGFRVFRPARLVLFMAYYNLFRPHSAPDGASPAEHLGPEIVTKTGSVKEKMKAALRYAALHRQRQRPRTVGISRLPCGCAAPHSDWGERCGSAGPAPRRGPDPGEQDGAFRRYGGRYGGGGRRFGRMRVAWRAIPWISSQI